MLDVKNKTSLHVVEIIPEMKGDKKSSDLWAKEKVFSNFSEGLLLSEKTNIENMMYLTDYTFCFSKGKDCARFVNDEVKFFLKDWLVEDKCSIYVTKLKTFYALTEHPVEKDTYMLVKIPESVIQEGE